MRRKSLGTCVLLLGLLVGTSFERFCGYDFTNHSEFD